MCIDSVFTRFSLRTLILNSTLTASLIILNFSMVHTPHHLLLEDSVETQCQLISGLRVVRSGSCSSLTLVFQLEDLDCLTVLQHKVRLTSKVPARGFRLSYSLTTQGTINF